MGEAIEAEKDLLLERVSFVVDPQSLLAQPKGAVAGVQRNTRCATQFMAFAVKVCEQLALQGYWADYIDPCSGLPVSN